MTSLFAVFNCCGISGNEKVQNYISSIHSFLAQRDVEFRVCLSSCLNSDAVRQQLLREFGNRISYNFVDERRTVNVTYNFSVRKMMEHFGKAAGYLYVDSGITLGTDTHVLAKMFSLHRTGKYGIVGTLTDDDSGIDTWYRLPNTPQNRKQFLKSGHKLILPGRTMNLHCQIFDHSLYEAYGNILPDIFASYCTESVFPALVAGVGKQFICHGNLELHHERAMDGPSSGFKPPPTDEWTHLVPEAPRPMREIIAMREARECGIGYEECKNILPHRPELFDRQGRSRKPDLLRKFITENLYLKPEHLDYSSIRHTFIP